MPITTDDAIEIKLAIQELSNNHKHAEKATVGHFERIEKKVDELYDIVASGNGGERSLVVRMKVFEKNQEAIVEDVDDLCNQYSGLCETVNELRDLAIAWKNRILVFLSILGIINTSIAIWAVFYK